jgi:NAD(P)-dependent dehydrogenase (short-subunit alcohol dehydrogenase family)
MARKGAKVYILDLNEPTEPAPELHFRKVNVASWAELRAVFAEAGHVDYAFANAGVSEETNYFADTFDAEGNLQEPTYAVLDVNLRGVLNFVKLAWSTMRKNGTAGSIVITTSATAYAPEQSLPVYASGKIAVRTLSTPFHPN